MSAARMKVLCQMLAACCLVAAGQVGSCGEPADSNNLALTNAARHAIETGLWEALSDEPYAA
jgi:hypothetical protein